LSKEANTIADKSSAKERFLEAITSGKGLIFLAIIVLAVALLAFVPIYPEISGTIQTQLGTPLFTLSSGPTLTRLTAIQASSTAKNQLFVIEGQTNSQTDFTLTVAVYYGNQFVWTGTLASLPTGQYFFGVLLYPRIEQPNVAYSVLLTATFPSGTSVEITSIVSP